MSVAGMGEGFGPVGARAAPARRRRLHRGALRTLTCGAAGFVILFGAIELFSRTSGLSEDSLPRATTILRRMAVLVIDAEFLGAVAMTLQSAGLGLLLAIVLAVPAGALLGSSSRAFAATNALIEFLRPIPAVAVIPPALLLFGTGLTMKLVLIVYAAFWILLYHTIYGVRDVDPITIDSARSYGFSRRQVLLKVSLPSALPFIYTGVRIAATATLLVAVGVELIGGGVEGIGRWLGEAQDAVTRRPEVYAGAFLTGVIGVAVNALLDLGERKALRWSVRTRKE